MNLFQELKRRNVFRAATAYVIAAWLIVQVVETILPAFGFSETAVRVTVIVLAIGFVPAMAVAWVFELTPGGFRREENVDYSSPAFRQFGKRVDRIIMVVLALALGLFAFDKFVLSESREAQIAESAAQAARSEALVESYGDKSIAVLPFADMSAEGDQEYMSDGIAEELLNLLARVPSLRVISRSSAFAFKGQNLEIPEIARRLAVTYILEGSVRKSQDRIRITTQLIDARSDTHLWSETYDRDLEDVFAIQDDVAAAVVNELKIKLMGDAPTVRQTDPHAYELLLQGKFFLGWVATREATSQAIELFEQVVEIDPTYVQGWEWLGGAYRNMGNFYFAEDPEKAEEYNAKSRESLRRAYDLNPDYPPVLATMGLFKFVEDNDVHGGAMYMRRALELAPGHWLVLGELQNFLRNLGRFDEAAEVLEYLLWLEPLNVVIQDSAIWAYINAGRFQDALDLAQSALQDRPDDEGLMVAISIGKLFTGDSEGALADAQLFEDPDLKLATGAIAFHQLGQVAESEAAIAELAEISQDNPGIMDVLAQVYATVGDADAAFETLNRMADEETIRDMLYNEPDFQGLHEDPRWAELMDRLGIIKGQYDNVELPVSIPARTRAP